MEPTSASVTQRLWGARFKSEPSVALKALSRSEPSFFRHVPYDLAGSRAHAHELQRAGILHASELDSLLTLLANGTYGAIIAKWNLQSSAVKQASVNGTPAP